MRRLRGTLVWPFLPQRVPSTESIANAVKWRNFAVRPFGTRKTVGPYTPAVPFRHCSSFPNESERKVLQFLKNRLSSSPYGYSKEKCILPSGSRSGN